MLELLQSDATGLFIIPVMPNGEVRYDLKSHVNSSEFRAIMLKSHLRNVDGFEARFVSENNHEVKFTKDATGNISFQKGKLTDLPKDLITILKAK
jgi:hypothetical protein